MGRFTESIQSFSFPEDYEKKLNELREVFVQKFPTSRIPNLRLEDYALGREPKENSFCWWVEFNTSEIARIGGANAFKHVIYYDREEKKYAFDKRYKSQEEAFEAVRSGLVKLLALAEQNRFSELETVPPFETKNLIRGKILYLYFPDKFLPISSLEHLKDFCIQFGVQADFESQSAMNAALVELKRSDPEVAEWSNLRFAMLLYQKFSPTVQFWKIAPGENAAFWAECRDGGFICVGWHEFGDMRLQDDKQVFQEQYRKLHPSSGSFRQWKEIWKFAKEVKVGDRVVANNGLNQIVGIGTCTGPYYYDSNRPQYKHCLPVQWDVVTTFDVPGPARQLTANWFQGTLKELSRDEYNQITGGVKVAKPVWRRATAVSYDLILTNPTSLDIAGAKSLYSQVIAAEFGGISQHVREDLRDWLDDTKSVLPSEAYVTLSNWFLSSHIYTQTDRAKFAEKLWDVLFAVRPERLSDTERNTKIIPSAFEAWWTKMKAAGAAVGIDTESPPQPPQPPATERYQQICRETFMPEQFYSNCERLLGVKKQIILQGAPGTGKTFIAEKLATLWAGDQNRVKIVQFHESYGYEDFVHGIKPKVDSDTKRTAFYPEPGVFLRFCEEIRRSADGQNHVLLIDEINRAKTARVFGELLYLLEYRDREVQLQNGDKFSIPPNLYIIGTMNTTDKSIALVDYALRRRFAFVDLPPVKHGESVVLRRWLDANGIENANDVDSLFIALNTAIAQKDEGLMVGHSYFMQPEAVAAKRFSDDLLNFLWDYYILPLVAEYEYQLSRSELESRYGLNVLRSDKAKAAIA